MVHHSPSKPMRLLSAGFARRPSLTPDGKLWVDGPVTELAFVSNAARVPLDGLHLVGVVEASEQEGSVHDVVVRLRGNDGRLQGEIAASGVKFAASRVPNDSTQLVHVRPFALPLSRISVPSGHTAQFEIVVDSGVIDSIPLPGRPMMQHAVAEFLGFAQDQQGVSGDETYLSARLRFTLTDDKGGFAGRHWVRVRQPEHRNFAEDPLIVTIDEAGYERLAESYEFIAKVHAIYDEYAKFAFGGTLHAGSYIAMASNWYELPKMTVSFDLPGEAGGGW
jgi:hypothetical protein